MSAMVDMCFDVVEGEGMPSKDSELDVEKALLELLAQRSTTSTICPSDVARDVGGETWRDLMEPVRAAARRLEAEGVVDIMQRGEVVDPATARGPIRIRLRPSPSSRS